MNFEQANQLKIMGKSLAHLSASLQYAVGDIENLIHTFKNLEKEMSKKFIQEAINPAHKGSLRKALHVKKGENIPAAKLAKAEHSKSPSLKKKAVLAETLKKMHKK